VSDKEFEKALEKYNQLTIARLPDMPRGFETISTGCLSLDLATGIGGFPRGAMVEVYGPEQGGKSVLMYAFMAEVQRSGGKGLFIDTEGKSDPDFITHCISTQGVAPDDIYVAHPESAEQTVEMLKDFIGKVDAIVIDSLASMTPNAQQQADADAQHPALLARLLGRWMGSIANMLYSRDRRTALVFTNQVRQGFGTYSYETTPGGITKNHACIMRIRVRRSDPVKVDKVEIGVKAELELKKNQAAQPGAKAEYNILFGTDETYYGLDPVADLVTVAPEYGVIELKGAGYYTIYLSTTGEEMPIRGKNALTEWLRANPVELQALRKKTLEAMK